MNFVGNRKCFQTIKVCFTYNTHFYWCLGKLFVLFLYTFFLIYLFFLFIIIIIIIIIIISYNLVDWVRSYLKVIISSQVPEIFFVPLAMIIINHILQNISYTTPIQWVK